MLFKLILGTLLFSFYSYEIGRKIRILYRVRFKDKTIVFLDVGTHKIY